MLSKWKNSSLFLPGEERCGGRGLAVEGVPVSLRDPRPGAQHCCLHRRGGGGGGVQLLIGGGAGHGDHPGSCWRLSPVQTLYYRHIDSIQAVSPLRALPRQPLLPTLPGSCCCYSVVMCVPGPRFLSSTSQSGSADA